MKKIITILITICLVLCLTGCAKVATDENPLYGRFFKIQNEECLYYDTNTKAVYFINYGTSTASLMSPYYASNGEVYLYNVDSGSLEVNE